MKEHPIFARFYERISPVLDDMGERDRRIEVVSGARGRVLELGSGNGLNFEHYVDASAVVALEPEPTMVALARRRAVRAPVPIRFVRGVAERLPFAEGSFDTVVASFVLCSVADPRRAVVEVARVLRPGGEVRYLEHVRSTGTLGALVQDAVTPLWRALAGGCHPNRDPAATFRARGFHVEWRRFPFGPPTPARPHMVGVARKP